LSLWWADDYGLGSRAATTSENSHGDYDPGRKIYAWHRVVTVLVVDSRDDGPGIFNAACGGVWLSAVPSFGRPPIFRRKRDPYTYVGGTRSRLVVSVIVIVVVIFFLAGRT
jgi:hypothetical protein